MGLHIHDFRFNCDTNKGHNHRITNYTESHIGFNIFHFHYFSGICTYRGHTHYYSGITGFPTRTANGHIHKIEGVLEITNLHEHHFSGFTGEEIQLNTGRFLRTVLV